METQRFEERKRAHIRHSLDPAHQALNLNGLDAFHLRHEALPNLNFDDVRLESPCLGQSLATPFFISGMTAGHDQAAALNLRFARLCARRGWALGVGSQRRELEAGMAFEGDAWKTLRDEFPQLILIGNIGVSQLAGVHPERIERLVSSLGASALAVHLNPLQECLQLEGTPRFKGALAHLATLCRELSIPVIIKETGCGLSSETLRRLAETEAAAVDVSGLGGTHWGRIEGARARESGSAESRVLAEASLTFADWGISTAESVIAARETLGAKEIWASGGVRSGLDAAKLIALGSHRVGFAQPALSAALEGDDALEHWMKRIELELRIALFCTGCANVDEIRGKEDVWKKRGN